MNSSQAVVSGYPGAKVHLAPRISSILYMRDITTYIEPFGGMWNVGLQSPTYPRRIYNDLDPNLCALFKALCNKESARELYQMLLVYPYSEDSFMTAKLLVSNESDPIRKALYTWVLLLMSVNGGRKQFKGFSKGNEHLIYKNKIIFKRSLFDILENVEVHNADALELLKSLNSPSVMAYLDPPYVFGKTARTGGKLYQFDYNTADQRHFVETVKNLQCRMVISGYRNELYDDTFAPGSGWFSYDFADVKKSMSIVKIGECKPSVKECLWANYNLLDGRCYR